MNLTTKFILLGGLVLCVSPFMAKAETSEIKSGRKPNVILIVSDDHGYADLGVQGATDIKTPHIDSLAKNGVRFTQGYVTSPICGPSRAGLLTGRYQARFGYENNPGPKPAETYGLPTDQKLISNYLKDAGYKTGAIGKWHLGNQEKYRPINRGFDETFGFLHGAHSYVPAEDKVLLNEIRRDDKVVTHSRYITYDFNDEAEAFIDKHKDVPFFLYVPYSAIHDPMHAAPGKEKQFAHIKDENRRTMATMLSALDDGVGQMLSALDRHGLISDTLVIFHSDNGGPTRGNASRNDPYRGGKSQLYEGGIRVPFVMQWKGKISAGLVYSSPVISLDILPTVANAVGLQVEESAKAKWDGRDLLSELSSGQTSTSVTRDLFWRFGDKRAIQSADYKLVTMEKGKWELYNLATDQREKKDLAREQPERVKDLLTKYDAWDAKNEDPRWYDSRDVKRARETNDPMLEKMLKANRGE